MKRLITAILIATTLASGCGSADTQTDGKTTKPENKTVDTPAPATAFEKSQMSCLEKGGFSSVEKDGDSIKGLTAEQAAVTVRTFATDDDAVKFARDNPHRQLTWQNQVAYIGSGVTEDDMQILGNCVVTG